MLNNKFIIYNKFRYLDLINYYKLCFIHQKENFSPKNFKIFLVEGNYHRTILAEILKPSDFKLFSKYKLDEINAAMDFFTSLDFDNVINRKWYWPHNKVIKGKLFSILQWFKLGDTGNLKRWYIFVNRFYALFLRSFYLLRKY